jgi:hypothetical protein
MINPHLFEEATKFVGVTLVENSQTRFMNVDGFALRVPGESQAEEEQDVYSMPADSSSQKDDYLNSIMNEPNVLMIPAPNLNTTRCPPYYGPSSRRRDKLKGHCKLM